MTRYLAVVLLVFLVSGAARLRPNDRSRDDKDQLQGEWTVVSGLAGKAAVKANDPKLTLKDNEWLMTWSGVKMTFKIDASKNPKELDLFSEQNTWPGIYKLEGDILTFCRSPGAGGERPSDFQGGQGMLMVFKRAGK